MNTNTGKKVSKPFYKSKTVWLGIITTSGLLAIIVSVLDAVNQGLITGQESKTILIGAITAGITAVLGILNRFIEENK